MDTLGSTVLELIYVYVNCLSNETYASFSRISYYFTVLALSLSNGLSKIVTKFSRIRYNDYVTSNKEKTNEQDREN